MGAILKFSIRRNRVAWRTILWGIPSLWLVITGRRLRCIFRYKLISSCPLGDYSEANGLACARTEIDKKSTCLRLIGFWILAMTVLILSLIAK